MTTVTPASASPVAASVTTPWIAPVVALCAAASRTSTSDSHTAHRLAAMKRLRVVMALPPLPVAADRGGLGGPGDGRGLGEDRPVLVLEAALARHRERVRRRR